MTVANNRFRELNISNNKVTVKQPIAYGSVWISMQYPNPLVDMVLALKITLLAFGSRRLSNIILHQDSVQLRREVLLSLAKLILPKYC